MKHYLALFLLLVWTEVSMAQQNPMRGYIITHEGDTIQGTIDFLSRSKCTWGCSFRKEGESEFKEYSPTDIAGYRLQDNGVYYVSRTFPLNGTNQTFFAEYLLQGGISLLRYQEGEFDAVFYLVDDSGHVAVVKDYGDLSQYRPEEATSHKRAALKEAMAMMSQSQTAMKRLWNEDITAKKLLSITRQYNNDYCASSGECVEFEYNAKKSASSTMHFLVSAGGVFGKFHRKRPYADAFSMSASAWRAAVGLEWTFPRMNENVAFQTLLSYSKWYSSTHLDFSNITLHVGANYSLSHSKRLVPIVLGGLSVAGNFVDGSLTTISSNTSDFELPVDLGVYVGGGVSCPVDGHVLRLTAQYEHPFIHRDDWASGVSVNLGLVF